MSLLKSFLHLFEKKKKKKKVIEVLSDYDSQKLGVLACVPYDVILHTLFFLTPSEVCGIVALVNHSFYSLTRHSEVLWKFFYYNYSVCPSPPIELLMKERELEEELQIPRNLHTVQQNNVIPQSSVHTVPITATTSSSSSSSSSSSTTTTTTTTYIESKLVVIKEQEEEEEEVKNDKDGKESNLRRETIGLNQQKEQTSSKNLDPTSSILPEKKSPSSQMNNPWLELFKNLREFWRIDDNLSSPLLSLSDNHMIASFNLSLKSRDPKMAFAVSEQIIQKPGKYLIRILYRERKMSSTVGICDVSCLDGFLEGDKKVTGALLFHRDGSLTLPKSNDDNNKVIIKNRVQDVVQKGENATDGVSKVLKKRVYYPVGKGDILNMFVDMQSGEVTFSINSTCQLYLSNLDTSKAYRFVMELTDGQIFEILPSLWKLEEMGKSGKTNEQKRLESKSVQNP